jgi:hypothetical protein
MVVISHMEHVTFHVKRFLNVFSHMKHVKCAMSKMFMTIVIIMSVYMLNILDIFWYVQFDYNVI